MHHNYKHPLNTYFFFMVWWLAAKATILTKGEARDSENSHACTKD
jgi:hypothetical protein